MEQYYEPCLGYSVPAGTEMGADLLAEMLGDYRANHLGRLVALRRAYEGDYAILHKRAKARFKPDNRLVANFARQMVDTMVGYFAGVPVRLASDDQAALDAIEAWGAYVGDDDLDAELSKTCDIYGSALEVMWRDEQARPQSSVVTPMNGFVVHDDTVARRPLYAVRFFLDDNRFDGEADCLRGTLYTPTSEVPFSDEGGVHFTGEPEPHGFPDVPVVEYVENEERRGLFEGVLSLIDAYNDALSEKANDVDYYADAYLKVLGASLDEETLKTLRDSRIINMSGEDAQGVVVDFLAKPDADGTQEHLIDRLERLIFTLGMVADVSSEDFGTASGIAIRYRLQAMSDLAMVKERKFRRGLARRWRLVLGYAGNEGVAADAWMSIRPTFTRNVPANLLEESQIAQNLSGIVSRETQLSVLSCVDSPAEEVRRLDEEAEAQADALVARRAPAPGEGPETA